MVYDLFWKMCRNWTDGNCCRHPEDLIKISNYTYSTNLFTLGLGTDCHIQSSVTHIVNREFRVSTKIVDICIQTELKESCVKGGVCPKWKCILIIL